MKNFYSMILLIAVMSVSASEKKLRTKLESNYDLQLAQKEKAIQSRKFLESVAKKQKKTNIRDDQRKNIPNNKNLEIKQQQNRQRVKTELYQASLFQHYSPAFDVLVTACVLPVIGVIYYSSILDIPVGCYQGHNVCICFYM